MKKPELNSNERSAKFKPSTIVIISLLLIFIVVLVDMFH
jgi:preprotein translocase subunit Sec61beta